MDKDELLERYEALGEDDDFLAAKPGTACTAPRPDLALPAVPAVASCHPLLPSRAQHTEGADDPRWHRLPARFCNRSHRA